MTRPSLPDAQRCRLLERDQRGKPTFRYVCAADTNVSATFERHRRELKASEATAQNVKPIIRRKA